MVALTSTKRGLKSERGAELIEFALVLPMLLVIVLGIVDFGFLFQRMQVMTNAAREGARIAVLQGYAITDVQARARAFVQTGGVPTTATNPAVQVTNVTIPTGAGGPTMTGRRVEVTYTHQYLFIGPIAGWFGGTFTSAPVRGIAIMRNEVQ